MITPGYPQRMPMRTAVVLVSIVILLAGLTAWLLKPAQLLATGPVFDAELATLSSDTITRIEVLDHTGTRIAMAKNDFESRQWILYIPRTSAWPAVASRPRGLAGILADLARKPAQPSTGPIAESFRTIMIERSDTPETRLAFAIDISPVGGITRLYKRAADGSYTAIHADANVANLFSLESMTAWRNLKAFVEYDVKPSTILLECSDGRIELTRVGTRWSITLPPLGPADPEAVAALERQLANFVLDERPGVGVTRGAEMTKANAVFFARITTELPDPNVPRLISQQLRILSDGVNDVSVVGEAITFFSDPATSPWGPLDATLTRPYYESITANPTAYASKLATHLARADIGMLRVTRADHALTSATPLTPVTNEVAAKVRTLSFTTTASGWRITQPGTFAAAGQATETGNVASPEQAKWIGQLRDLLTSTRAERVRFEAPKDLKGEIVLTLASPGGAPLDVVAIGVCAREILEGEPKQAGVSSTQLVVRRASGAYLIYTAAEGAELIDWLERAFPPEG